MMRMGIPIVLLPQALGPFEGQRIASAFRGLASHVDLIYARDPESYTAAVEASRMPERIRLSTDFTNLAPASPLPPDVEGMQGRACIVPNARMLDKTAPEEADTYVDFLCRCATAVTECGVRPCILLHEAREDSAVADAVNEKLTFPLTVFTHADPRVLKGMLGAADFVIGSRFHALAGALSQAVPCIGTGWSHKYKALFEEYGCPDFLIRVDTELPDIIGRIRRLMGPDRQAHVSKLQEAGRILEGQTQEMWHAIDAVLGLG